VFLLLNRILNVPLVFPRPPVWRSRGLHRDAVWPRGRGRVLHGLQLPPVCPAGLRSHPVVLRWQTGLRVVSQAEAAGRFLCSVTLETDWSSYL